ncbi:hypothetical protein Hanom_Chr03g00215011 [Helianthus anomalus]
MVCSFEFVSCFMPGQNYGFRLCFGSGVLFESIFGSKFRVLGSVQHQIRSFIWVFRELWFDLDSGIISGLFRFGQRFGSAAVNSQHRVKVGQRGSAKRHKDSEYYRCTLANSRSWNDTSESR